jgi:hypothetical protein
MPQMKLAIQLRSPLLIDAFLPLPHRVKTLSTSNWNRRGIFHTVSDPSILDTRMRLLIVLIYGVASEQS